MDFKYPSLDPLAFLVDDEIRPFDIDTRQDLTGTGDQACPTVANGIFIVHEHKVPDATAEVVLDVYPHAWLRTNPGTPQESARRLTRAEIEGFALFDATKDQNQPFIVENDYNLPTIAGAGNNTNRQKLRGSTFISEDSPMMANISMRNPLRAIYLPPGSTFRVLFRLMPTPATSPLPNTMLIGSGSNRVDFAGARVTGVRMPVSVYDKLKTARRMGLLGPEGSAGAAR